MSPHAAAISERASLPSTKRSLARSESYRDVLEGYEHHEEAKCTDARLAARHAGVNRWAAGLANAPELPLNSGLAIAVTLVAFVEAQERSRLGGNALRPDLGIEFREALFVAHV